MKLLVYTPTFDNGYRPDCRASVEAQQTSHAWEWIVDEDDPFPAPDHRNVLAKYKRARKIALDQGFDALITVEHDMVLPPDAFEKLAATRDCGVVYAPYVLRHGSYPLNTWQYCGPHNIGMSLTIYPQELAAYRKAGFGRISGCGWGCTLIYRTVLERIPFHDGNGHNPPGDIQFATDCLRASVISMGRFDAPCGHYDEEGRILMPYEHAPLMTRVEALQDVIALVEGEPLKMIKGMRYSVTIPVAYDLERAGYVKMRPTEAAPPVEQAITESDEAAVLAPPSPQRKRRKEH